MKVKIELSAISYDLYDHNKMKKKEGGFFAYGNFIISCDGVNFDHREIRFMRLKKKSIVFLEVI